MGCLIYENVGGHGDESMPVYDVNIFQNFTTRAFNDWSFLITTNLGAMNHGAFGAVLMTSANRQICRNHQHGFIVDLSHLRLLELGRFH